MWLKLALTAVQIGLKLFAPKSCDTLKEIQKVAEVALPIVEGVADADVIRNGDSVNEIRWKAAMTATSKAIANISDFESMPKEHILESGVQLAYSIFKGAK